MQPRKINDIFIEVFNDKNGDLLFASIKANDKDRLRELINHYADISLLKDGINCFQYAARLGRWTCASIIFDKLLKHIDAISYSNNAYEKMYKLGIRIAEVLRLAIKADQHEMVKKIFNLVYEKKYHAIISVYGKEFHDPENGYTALHWAVKKNNPVACSYFIQYSILNSFSPYQKHPSYELHLFHQKDHRGETPLDLAVSLNHIDIIKEIAKGMSFLGMIRYTSYDNLYKIFLADIRLEFKAKKYEGNSNSASSDNILGRTRKFQKLIYNDILALPTDERKRAINLILDKATLLSVFFNSFRTEKKCKKYIDNLIKSLSTDAHDKPEKSIQSTFSSSMHFFATHKNSAGEDNTKSPKHALNNTELLASRFRKTDYETISSTSETFIEATKESTNVNVDKHENDVSLNNISRSIR